MQLTVGVAKVVVEYIPDREKGLINTVETHITSGGLIYFYKPSQVAELKKKLKNK